MGSSEELVCNGQVSAKLAPQVIDVPFYMIRNRRVLIDAGTRVGKVAKSLVGPRPLSKTDVAIVQERSFFVMNVADCQGILDARLVIVADRVRQAALGVEHLEENVAAADLKMDESKMNELSHAARAR